MVLSAFITTLILFGFSVRFSPIANLKVLITIEKDGTSLQHIVNLPEKTTGNEIDSILYEHLKDAYTDFNIVMNPAKRKNRDKTKPHE